MKRFKIKMNKLLLFIGIIKKLYGRVNVVVLITCLAIWSIIYPMHANAADGLYDYTNMSGVSFYYVRDGDSGSGTSWSDAADDLPDPLVRDTVYFIGDGNYAVYGIDVATSGADWIYLVKATGEDHGTDTGWSSTYGDGEAVWNNAAGNQITLDASYIVIDGQVRNANWKGGYGIRIVNHDYPAINTYGIYAAAGSNTQSHIRLAYIDFQGAGEDAGTSSSDKQRQLYTLETATDWKVQYCYFHDSNNVHIRWDRTTDSFIEYCYFEDRHTDGTAHGEAISANYNGSPANIVIRWNYFEDTDGTGIIVIKDSTQSHFYIYGNLFFNSGNMSRYSPSQGFVCNTGGDTNNNMYIFNNTIVDIEQNDVGVLFDSGSNNFVYNNLFYNAAQVGVSGATHDYNAYGSCTGTPSTTNIQTNITSGIFTNYSGDDFSLGSATDGGLDLTGEGWWSGTYCSPTDMNGNTWGADGTWDRGAFEFSDDGTPSNPSGVILIPTEN